jgi:hypothetical protein
MWWKLLIGILYVLIALAIGRYLFIKRAYIIMECRLCSLDEAKLITGDSYVLEWFCAPIVWPIYLTICFIFNVVDKAYSKVYEKSRTKSS